MSALALLLGALVICVALAVLACIVFVLIWLVRLLAQPR
ncbi:MAG: hypothetical protein AVDCRST_MAG18-165 [uncultured Thermomicrobiales bacterium]|uniref:Uncharacterized protein n=1 Tax=uncultured Thermomicrobiales bacterium TaxID=1645740 RepID=A0A6J4UIZ3_9BACT|nr:MAG: hypothetical protein AVDCRST_MAG18-165 [uncultured Thermomicrobiales bacterium]